MPCSSAATSQTCHQCASLSASLGQPVATVLTIYIFRVLISPFYSIPIYFLIKTYDSLALVFNIFYSNYLYIQCYGPYK